MRQPSKAAKRGVSFRGAAHTSIKSLYAAASASRDGSEEEFTDAVEELQRLLRAAGELPQDSPRVERLRRVQSCTQQRVFFHLVADMSDGTTKEGISLKKACQFAFKSSS